MEVRNHLHNANGLPCFDMNNDRARTLPSVAFNTPYPSNLNQNPPNQFTYPHYDVSWNQTVQSKINAPLNSTEGHTGMMLMLLKTVHDNQIVLGNISKRLEKIERQFLNEPQVLPQTNFVMTTLPNEAQHKPFDNNPNPPIYPLPDQTSPNADFLFSPMENDFHLYQFENNLNQPTYRNSVIQHLRQRIGSNIRETVRRMIFALITQEFSMKFNRTGANNKYAFKAKLESLIKEATIGLFSCSERDIEVAIVRTLKEVKDRVSSRKK